MSLGGLEAGEAAACNKRDVLGRALQGEHVGMRARPHQLRMHSDTERVIHDGEPGGHKHSVPNSTLPAPAQVLLSFAAGQILTFFHSAGQWN